MLKTIKGNATAFVVGGILLVLTLTASTAWATANTWHLSIRDGTDTADTVYDLDRPGTGEDHVLVYDDSTTFPSWKNPAIFKSEFLDFYYDYIDATELATANATLQSNINAVAGQASLGTTNSRITAFLGNAASTTPYVASSSPGFMTGAMVTKLNGVPRVERVRAQTNASGAYTFTFGQAFSASTTPVVSIDVENTTAGITQAYITAISNTSVSIQTSRATNVLGLLTLQSSPQLIVHITAVEP